MVKDLGGVVLVLIGASAAWFILGQTLVERTQTSDSAQRDQLALFDEGYSGLSITIGPIVTLFVTMQVTGRIDWSEHFSRKRSTPAQGAAYSSPS